MGKAEEFEKKAFKLAGAGWKNDLGLLSTYNRLLKQDAEEEVIRQSTKTIQESFTGKRKDLAYAKLIKGLEEIALEVVRGRAQRQEWFENQKTLLEEQLKFIAILKKREEGAFALFEKNRNILLIDLNNQIAEARRLQAEAREATRKADAKVEELNKEILSYGDKVHELNLKTIRVNKLSAKYNRKVRDLNRQLGMRA